jgi:acetyl-CoA carboxylase biotin carboxylase subunit
LVAHGHAIEFRINAEDPETFIPNPGKITLYAPSGGLGVRVDSAVYSGYTIPSTYDSMIAKLVVHAQSRPACIMRAERAMDEFVIEGIKTTIPLQKELLKNTDVRQLKTDNHWLEHYLESKKQ